MTFLELVAAELESARGRYVDMHSLHEGYATILEELDEFWDEAKRKPHLRCGATLLRELVQVAAMAARTAEDCGLMAGEVKRETIEHGSTITGGPMGWMDDGHPLLWRRKGEAMAENSGDGKTGD